MMPEQISERMNRLLIAKDAKITDLEAKLSTAESTIEKQSVETAKYQERVAELREAAQKVLDTARVEGFLSKQGEDYQRFGSAMNDLVSALIRSDQPDRGDQ